MVDESKLFEVLGRYVYDIRVLKERVAMLEAEMARLKQPPEKDGVPSQTT